MKQPIINFLNYFGRVSEVRKIKEENLKLIETLKNIEFIKSKDKEVITKLLDFLANPKKRWFVQPLEVKASYIPWVRETQEVIAKYLSVVSSEVEMNFIQELFKASENFFRYQEMFEQNALFFMFLLGVITIIITPIIVIFV